MGTSPITPCYYMERFETKTYLGLGPGESIQYTKHRVSLEGHPWPGCHPEVTPGVYIVFDRASKEGLEQCWSSEPERLLLKQKGLWPARRDIQAVKPCKCRRRGPASRLTMSEMDNPLDHAQEASGGMGSDFDGSILWKALSEWAVHLP